jgi:hypothetical protein
MIRNLLGKEEAGAAAVLALSGALVALVCKGEGPVSTHGMLSRVLSNPIPNPTPRDIHHAITAPSRRAAA